jgi:hypothetical protein
MSGLQLAMLFISGLNQCSPSQFWLCAPLGVQNDHALQLLQVQLVRQQRIIRGEHHRTAGRVAGRHLADAAVSGSSSSNSK